MNRFFKGLVFLFLLMTVSANTFAEPTLEMKLLHFPLVNENDARVKELQEVLPSLNPQEQKLAQQLISALESYPQQRRPSRNELTNLLLEFYNATVQFGKLYPQNFKIQSFVASETYSATYELERMRYPELKKVKADVLNHVDSLVETFPDNPDAYYQKAFVLLYEQNLEESMQTIERCLELQEDHKNCLRLQGDLKEYLK